MEIEKELQDHVRARVNRKELNKKGIFLLHTDPGMIEVFLQDNHPTTRSAVYYQRTDLYGGNESWGFIFFKKIDESIIKMYIPSLTVEERFVGYIGHKDDRYSVAKVRDKPRLRYS